MRVAPTARSFGCMARHLVFVAVLAACVVAVTAGPASASATSFSRSLRRASSWFAWARLPEPCARPNRANGAGSIYVEHGAHYGPRVTIEGGMTNRELGSGRRRGPRLCGE